jgi:hypothetical protein
MTEVIVLEFFVPRTAGNLVFLERGRGLTRSGSEVYFEAQVGVVVRTRQPVSWVNLWFTEVRVQVLPYEEWSELPL